MSNIVYSLFNMIDDCVKQCSSIKEQKGQIEDEKKELISRYASEIERMFHVYTSQLDEDFSQLNNNLTIYDNLLKTYSTFDIDALGNVLESLINKNDEESVSYQKTNHDMVVREYTWLDRIEYRKQNEIALLVKNKVKQANYSDNSDYKSYINNLVDNGNAIVLSENKTLPRNITIYSLKNGKANSSINFSKFPYVEEFIKYAVQNRFENELKQVSEYELGAIMLSFIKEKNSSKQFVKNKINNK